MSGLHAEELAAWLAERLPGVDVYAGVNRDSFPPMSDAAIAALIKESYRLTIGEIRRAERNVLGEIRKVRRQMAEDTSALGQELDGIESDVTAEEVQISAVQAEILTLEAKAADGSISGEEHQRLEALKASIEADTTTLSGLATGGEPVTADPTDPATPADPSTPAATDGTETSAPTA